MIINGLYEALKKVTINIYSVEQLIHSQIREGLEKLQSQMVHTVNNIDLLNITSLLPQPRHVVVNMLNENIDDPRLMTFDYSGGGVQPTTQEPISDTRIYILTLHDIDRSSIEPVHLYEIDNELRTQKLASGFYICVTNISKRLDVLQINNGQMVMQLTGQNQNEQIGVYANESFIGSYSGILLFVVPGILDNVITVRLSKASGLAVYKLHLMEYNNLLAIRNLYNAGHFVLILELMTNNQYVVFRDDTRLLVSIPRKAGTSYVHEVYLYFDQNINGYRIQSLQYNASVDAWRVINSLIFTKSMII